MSDGEDVSARKFVVGFEGGPSDRLVRKGRAFAEIRSDTFGEGVTRPVRPLLVVPGLFSTEIVDDEVGHIWGRLRNLYGGPPIATLDGLRGRPGRIVRVIPIIP